MHRPLPTPPVPWLRAQAALIFLVCTAAYFLTRTPALDEWDSVQFAMGVGDFNLWKHQPHPPGYPLYIAAGWLGVHSLGLDVTSALQLASALGGGLFVASWFALAARHFGAGVAWTLAAALGTLLITWMSATKALTDPLAVGLLSLTLLCADRCRRVYIENPLPWLVTMGLAGAAAVGVRPQNFGVVLLIVCLATGACRPLLPLPRGRRWTVALVALLGGCLLWLLPTMFTQARLPESRGNLHAYTDQLTRQWRWRLNQPKAFVAAYPTADNADPGKNIWVYRLERHPLGWLTRGFGFAVESFWGWLGIGVLAVGWAGHVRSRRGRDAWPPPADGPSFWREHLPWAAVYVAMVFCFLPGDQRYYLPIFPLLILPAVLGWRACAGEERGPWLAWIVPAATLAATLPFIGPNHTDPAPPVKLMRWLQARHPPGERVHVVLVLHDTLRHAQWYAPDFTTHALDAEGWQMAPPPMIYYTDEPRLALTHAQRGSRPVVTFQRSPLIYRKHNHDTLYLLHYNEWSD